MILRYESWGAWVKLESTAAIVALDRDGVRALGLDGGAAWGEQERPSAPIEVHMAVTARCGAGCEGCYIDARPDGVEPPRAVLERELDVLHDAGVFTVAFGGGEPTTRDDLDALASAARARGITPVLTTSGLGLSEARLEKLRGFAQVNVSYDGAGDTYARVRGFDGAAAAERAIVRLTATGVRVGVNVVLTRESFPRVAETLARARSLGACEAQLLRYKPAGRAASLDYLARRLSAEQARALGPTLRALARDLCGEGDFHVRIDCALVAFLSADEELAGDPARLTRFGVLGCEAGGALAAFTVDGRVAPCSFAHATELPAAALAGHGDDPELARWRAYVAAPAEPCASCSLRPVCKGGCKVVSSFVDGCHGPDPECPRVLAHRKAGAS
ncbi:MAG TPA: radical SAM protein [Polyangiaceae bacterium]|jgi:radical SAM protein with 4Fe4S-binding SPASM domain